MPDLFVATHNGTAFYFPERYVTDTGAILAKRGTGKSNVGVVIAEEMHSAGHQWVAIDPGGDWWGIRSDGPGSPGLPVLILGGLHGDLPLHPSAGAAVAELIVEQGVSCVLDVSDFDTKADQVRFLTDFGRRLFDLQRRNPSPIHVILEEAQEVLPQQVTADMTRCVSIWTKLVKIGRKHGVGVSLITQRSAALNNGALTQIDTLVVLRTPAAADKKAIRGWVEGATDTATWKEVEASLSRLANGEAWVVSPHFMQFTGRVMFRRRHTFDSGATPELGQARQAPSLASIDLTGIEVAMAEVVEQAAVDDPALLRKQVSQLKAELEAARSSAPEPVPVIDGDAVAALGEVAHALRDLPGLTAEAVTAGVSASLRNADGIASGLVSQIEDVVARAASAQVAAPSTAPRRPRPTPSSANTVVSANPPFGWLGAAVGDIAPGLADSTLPPRAQKVLTTLAQFPAGRTRTQIIAFTAMGGSTVDRALADLRAAGLVTTGNPIQPTAEGLALAGPLPPAPPPAQLAQMWLGRLSDRAQRVLTLMLDAHPRVLTRGEIIETTGMGGSTVDRALADLRRPLIVNGFTVSPELVGG